MEELEDKLSRRSILNCEHCGNTLYAKYSSVSIYTSMP